MGGKCCCIESHHIARVGHLHKWSLEALTHPLLQRNTRMILVTRYPGLFTFLWIACIANCLYQVFLLKHLSWLNIKITSNSGKHSKKEMIIFDVEIYGFRSLEAVQFIQSCQMVFLSFFIFCLFFYRNSQI